MGHVGAEVASYAREEVNAPVPALAAKCCAVVRLHGYALLAILTSSVRGALRRWGLEKGMVSAGWEAQMARAGMLAVTECALGGYGVAA